MKDTTATKVRMRAAELGVNEADLQNVADVATMIYSQGGLFENSVRMAIREVEQSKRRGARHGSNISERRS